MIVYDFENIKLNYEDIIEMINSLDIEMDEDDMYDEIDNVTGTIDELAEKRILTLYRVIHLNNINDLKGGVNIGESWSWNKDAAINFGMSNVRSPRYLIKAKTNKRNINWKLSIYRYFQNSYGSFGDEENELVVKNGDCVEILDIEKIK